MLKVLIQNNKKSLAFVFILGLVIFGVRSSLIEPFKIPTRSMLPNLLMGDFLFAHKFKYGFHLPFTDIFLTRSAPKIGDVIVFEPSPGDALSIKRVVAVGGDRIRFEGKQFIRNDLPVTHDRLPEAEERAMRETKGLDPDGRYDVNRLHIYRERIEQSTYLVMEDSGLEAKRFFEEITVPPQHFFVLADNRDDARDSRDFGSIPLRAVKGKAWIIWMSLRWSLTDTDWAFRPERIGRMIR